MQLAEVSDYPEGIDYSGRGHIQQEALSWFKTTFQQSMQIPRFLCLDVALGLTWTAPKIETCRSTDQCN